MSRKKALITGITGQDGAYLAKLLANNGYQVFGGIRRTSSRILHSWRLEALQVVDQVQLLEFEIQENYDIARIVRDGQFDEIYNLSAQSFVHLSFEHPHFTTQLCGVGPLNLLEAIRTFSPQTKFYQASTSEMFGRVTEIPQSETTPFHPCSPYAVAKLFGHWITVNYREAHNLFANSGILFNHESPLRGIEFVTQKIAQGLARCVKDPEHVLELGNLDAVRDWGHAADFVRGMWLMMQHDEPGDFVLATGRTATVREFASRSARALGIGLEWIGTGLDERGVDQSSGRVLIEVSPKLFRPAEVDLLSGDPSKAKAILDWEPTISLEDMIEEMTAFCSTGQIRFGLS